MRPGNLPLPKTTTTQLKMIPAPFIIGPMIRKMREDKAKKNAPLVSEEEISRDAPGLRVGNQSWKWPPVWPYEEDFFVRGGDKTPELNPNAMNMMMNGGAMPTPRADADVEEEELMDSLKYWGEDKVDVLTEIDAEAADKLRGHYAYYLKDGMDVLELGAAEESYLPTDLKLNRHVGVGANPKLLAKNQAFTEPALTVDLNQVIPEIGVDSEELTELGEDKFDAIIMANTIDFLTQPRMVYRSAWRLLKPGGLMLVAFTNRDAYVEKFEDAQTRMWRNFNDDQHMWIAGSFFQFSAAEGWEDLKGFDISPEGAADEKQQNPLLAGIMNKNKPMNMFVVQATKAKVAEEIKDGEEEQAFRSMMWMSPTLEERDKMLVAPRIGRAYKLSTSSEEKESIKNNINVLPKIYESLIKMDQFQFPFNLQAQLAANVATDGDFTANDEQLAALKMGLGLKKPSEEFWQPVGQLTANMDPEDKVNLLSHIVPRFGSGNPDQEAALEAFVSGLKPTFAIIKSKCPTMNAGDVELVGTELLAAEILKPGRSTRSEFAEWVGALTEEELNDYLTERKAYRDESEKELKAMQDEREAELTKQKDELEAYKKEMERVREERSMVFNEETGKMEEVKK
eukprot:CAMPEP_0195529612 /NCGR_PEP_ID=MMETSP0794_2-20130614/32220_1 /TAXON_ID=515487 /ORGANISM="Stephanopyxis turris, Strain CCMP 815" /LENGTH=623 /DNA_ID=CAMNT_0040660941 /DNA_START=247 /DNA_END=2118 /DNA_ORIENTATION=-